MKATPFELAQLAIQLASYDEANKWPTDYIENALVLLEDADDALKKAFDAYRTADLEQHLPHLPHLPHFNRT